MAINKAEFNKAFREVVSAEFSHIPCDEDSINYTFSERFNKRMEKLIKSQKKPYWNFISTASKRAAVIIVAILTVFTAAFSVKAIREPILKFIKQIYETFIHYSYEGDTIEIIAQEYTITPLPDGYEQVDKTKTDNSVVTTYRNSNGDSIVFSQFTSKYSIGYFVDNENGDLYTETVNGISVNFKEWYDTKTAIWTQDGYVFTIDSYGNISFDDIKQMIQFIK